MELKQKIESLLFVSSKPLSYKTLAKLTGATEGEVRKAGAELVEDRKEGGVVVLEANGNYQMATNAENSDLVKSFLNQDLREKLTEATQERGLSGRDSLPPNTGMLFVFKEPAAYQFWMKDMKFPIDIIWFAADQTITYIKQNATPDSYPTIFEPPYLSLYVLEVPAGFAEAHGLNIGDQAVIKR
jgi:uncharacterized membrane protein (UPF0127 family)